MKAMVLNKFGGIENFEKKNILMPEEIKPGEVLVNIKAIGIDQIDIKTRKGSGMASKFDPDKPIVLGWDISGVVMQTGKDVHDFKVGDEVFGTINFPGPGSSYAEYTAAPADQIALKPSNISHTEAAAATQSPLTAWQALVTTGKIKRGDKVLIHGAAGGVGNYAVQIAHHLGAYVVGTASSEDKIFVESLGADEVIDYKTQRFEEITGCFDFILDSIGGENFERSLQVLKPEGVIVLLPSDKKEAAEKVARDQEVQNYYHILMNSNGEDMKQIAALLENGSLKVHINQTFSFDRIPQAHEQMEAGDNRGKIVVSAQ